jgi:DNA-binding MarR family transcriptional regulator
MTDAKPELTPAERTVLDVLAEERRVNLHLLREQTGLDEDSITTALNSLLSADLVRKVTTELYEFVDHVEGGTRGIPEIPNKDNQTAPINPSTEDDKPES